MPYTHSKVYAYTPVKYVGESGSIPTLLLYERDGLAYVRFWTRCWRQYNGWSGWVTTALHSEHVVTADPHEPAVASLLGELEREAAVMRHRISEAAYRQGQAEYQREPAKYENQIAKYRGTTPRDGRN
jgi:hypothetical protein